MIDFEDTSEDDLVLDTEALATEAEIVCPYCGEPNLVGLDPGGGEDQEYFEDCQVCCRPWVVRVNYASPGRAQVYVEAADDPS